MQTTHGRTQGKLLATMLGGHGLAPAPVVPEALAETRTAPILKNGRGTVLPRPASADRLPATEARARYQRVKALGEGAMGRVDLVRDNDIQRTVAVKHLLESAMSSEGLARFADEVRVVGQLEHPGIAPIYDVDRGEDGQLFLVMKHVQGETMERIIERLRAGDPAYEARHSRAYRVRLFRGVLDAMTYAHARGVLHRDLKPANIMIGPYGEVTVLDWGIAKPLTAPGAATPAPGTRAAMLDARMLQTARGAIAGTPLYMSPEQASGLNDELDERSDVYALCVLLYEWLVLEHPLRDKQTFAEIQTALVVDDYALGHLFEPAQRAGVPMEYLWIIRQGLRRDRSARFQSVAELDAALGAVEDGRIPVQCNVTWAKNRTQLFVQWIDRHPVLFTSLVRGARALATFAAAGALGALAWRLFGG